MSSTALLVLLYFFASKISESKEVILKHGY